MKKGELKHVEKAGINPPPTGKKRPPTPKRQGTKREMCRSSWISSAHRLPSNSDEVWAYDACEYGVVAGYHTEYGWFHVYGDGDGLGDDHLYNVTHWQLMSRPEAPGEERDV